MRAEIEARAKRLLDVEPVQEVENEVARSRKGHKRSKASHNPDQLKESELREMSVVENATCRLSKKRHLKNLSEDEVDKIIATSKKPGWLMKDIARKYRIASQLVGKLCREAVRKPEDRERRLERKQLNEDKRQAIGEVTQTVL